MTKQLWKSIVRFMLAEDGPTAVEYVVMLSTIILVAFLGIKSLGTATADMFQDSATKMP